MATKSKFGTTATTPPPPPPPPSYSGNLRVMLLDILQEEKSKELERLSSEAVQECAVTLSRMKEARSKTLSGSLLEALGLGRPLKQGGRATDIEPEDRSDRSSRRKSKIRQPN